MCGCLQHLSKVAEDVTDGEGDGDEDVTDIGYYFTDKGDDEYSQVS